MVYAWYNGRFDLRFDSNAKKRFAGPYVKCVTGFIIRNISDDNVKHTALDVFNGFRLFFGNAAMPRCKAGLITA